MTIYNLEEIIIKGAHDIERNTLASHFNEDYIKEKFDERMDEMKQTTEYKIAKYYAQACLSTDPYEFTFWLDQNALNVDYEYRLEMVKNIVDVPTLYEECQKHNLTGEDVRKPGFESRFEHELGKVLTESNDRVIDMLYNSGEFTIVFQCDDPNKTIATCLPFEAESHNQLVEAIRNFIKNSY